MYKKSVIAILLGTAFVFLLIIGFSKTSQDQVLVEPNFEVEESMSPVVTPSRGGVEIDADSSTDIKGEGQMPQGKIDVRVACESALMYTTFQDGAAAEAFVEDCVNGEHPEVIERFIKDMGVDGAVI